MNPQSHLSYDNTAPVDCLSFAVSSCRKLANFLPMLGVRFWLFSGCIILDFVPVLEGQMPLLLSLPVLC